MKNILFKLKTALTACLPVLIFGATVFAQTANEPQTLSPGQTIEREITGAETHRYKLDLKKDEFFQVRVEQKGVDVALKLLDADGITLATMNSPNGKEGPETLSLIVLVTGSYILEISGFDAKAGTGNYSINRQPPRIANAQDKKRVETEHLFVEAMTARNLMWLKRIATAQFQRALQGWQELNDNYLIELTSVQIKQLQFSSKLERANLTYAAAHQFFIQDTTESKLKSLQEFEEARKLYVELGNRQDEADCLMWSGRIFSFLGENQKALEYYNQALSLYIAVSNKSGEAITLNNIGYVYLDLRENQKALNFFNQSLSLDKIVGNKSGEATTLNNIGNIYLNLRENQKALEFFNQALLLMKAIENKRGEAATLHNIGLVYSSLREKQKALEYFNQSLPILVAVEDKQGEARTLHNIGRAYEDLGENQKAAEYYNQSLLLMKAIGNKSGEAVALSNVMFFWNTLGNYKLAVFYGKQSVNLLQEMRTNIHGLDKEIQKTYLRSVESTYRRLADILIAQGRIAEAEQVLGMLKEEEYFSYLRRDDAVARDLKGRISLSADEKKAFEDYEKYSDEITKTAEEYEALKKKIPFGGTFASLSAEEQAKYKELENKYNAAVTIFNKYLDDLKIKFANNGEQYKQVAAVESDTIGLLKSLGQPHTVIISTIVGEDRLNLIVTTSDIQKAHTVEIKAADLNKLVADFRVAVKNPQVDPRPLGKQLYDKLFPAALQKDLENIKADTIIWSLDGTLRYVPMAALWDGQKYLVERYNNAVITLASRDKLNAATTDRAKWQAFGVGVSKKFESFDALPAVPKELCSVVKDGKKSDFCKNYGETGIFDGLMLPDEEFTFDVFQQNLGKTAIVHIASHFALNPGEYNDSYLLLGGGANRRFSLDSLKKTRLDKIELLTLSACNTAMTSGANSSGVEIEGFGALAQNQGAKSVLATLWAVADDSTGELMIGFYQTLENNPQIGKAEALRQSQIALLQGKTNQITKHNARSDFAGETKEKTTAPTFAYDEKKPFAHPYYWSPFVLIGNWR